MEQKLGRREAEQYVYDFTGLDIAALGGLAEEKYTKHELNQLVTDLVKHKEDEHDEQSGD